MADLGVASSTEMKEHADMIANLDPSRILIADMDTGYGGTLPIITLLMHHLLIAASRPNHHHENCQSLYTGQCRGLSH